MINLQLGDCLKVLKTLPDNTIDATITDPPYELGFMGKAWDNTGIAYKVELWKEVLRVLKPGGHLLSFGGSRTYHRMACAIEDAGFEIRDMIEWVYGSGFPKSLNIGKAVDKLRGNEREVVDNPNSRDRTKHDATTILTSQDTTGWDKTKGTSEWEGWGTALKPAHEPIVLARKPLSEKTVAENVLKWGVGGINIDGCRVPTEGKDKEKHLAEWDRMQSKSAEKGGVAMCGGLKAVNLNEFAKEGRFPANFIHDGSNEVVDLFPNTKSGALNSGHKRGDGTGNSFMGGGGIVKGNYGNDSGSASRFFYCVKASKRERDMGCEGIKEKDIVTFATANGTSGKPSSISEGRETKYRNNHPCVKPLSLMLYLVTLISREGQTVLDPFAGSFTTAMACKKLKRNCIAIEKDKDYFEIGKKRIKNI